MKREEGQLGEEEVEGERRLPSGRRRNRNQGVKRQRSLGDWPVVFCERPHCSVEFQMFHTGLNGRQAIQPGEIRWIEDGR